MANKSFAKSLSLLTSLFFLWGFLTSMNDILIPYLKGTFNLSYVQANLVQFAFFGAYFIGSVIYFAISMFFGDPINKIGYKRGIIYGLLISAVGSGLFYPAAGFQSYGFFLSALFILGLGFTLLQISANPYVAVLGDESTASSRLNLAQGFNSLGTTLAPLVGGYLIFNYFASSDQTGAEAVRIPYLVFTGFLLLVALLIQLVKLPRIQNDEHLEKGLGALRYRHLSLGVVAIFMYVGAEVSIGSMMISFLGEDFTAGLSEERASDFVALYWGGLMIGRFLGALSLGKMKSKVQKYLLMLLSALAGFALLYLAIRVKSDHLSLSDLLPFLGLILLNFVAFMLGGSKAGRTTMIFALFSVLLLIFTVFSSGYNAVWAVVGIGLFNSIMWSNIFTLSIQGLGKYASQGSSLLVMAIVGGALFPIFQGWLAGSEGIQVSFALPIIAYLYIAYYGWKGHRIVDNKDLKA